MLWVIIFGAIAVAGLAMLASYGVWLLHKTSDVMSEVRVLAASGATLVELAGQVRLPQVRTARIGPDLHNPGTLVDGDVG